MKVDLDLAGSVAILAIIISLVILHNIVYVENIQLKERLNLAIEKVEKLENKTKDMR